MDKLITIGIVILGIFTIVVALTPSLRLFIA